MMRHEQGGDHGGAVTFSRTKRFPPVPAGRAAFTVCTVPLSERIAEETPAVLQLPGASVSLHSTAKAAPAFTAETARV